jgi:hypothetical protein
MNNSFPSSLYLFSIFLLHFLDSQTNYYITQIDFSLVFFLHGADQAIKKNREVHKIHAQNQISKEQRKANYLESIAHQG